MKKTNESIVNNSKNKKMLKSILIILFIILVIILLADLYKWFVLKQVQEYFESSKDSSNYSFIAKSNNSQISFWKMGNLEKQVSESKDLNAKITRWQDNESGEYYTIFNESKKYSTENKLQFYKIPTHSYTDTGSNNIRVLLAITPTLNVKGVEYNGIKAYKISMQENVEIISKDKGLLLYSKYGDNETFYEYSFDTVTRC